LNEYLNNIAADKIVPKGFTTPFPAISGAEPCTGSYNPIDSDKLADGNIPIEPVNTEPSSLKISPNIFSVTITSKYVCSVMRRIAVESTNMCSTSTSG